MALDFIIKIGANTPINESTSFFKRKIKETLHRRPKVNRDDDIIEVTGVIDISLNWNAQCKHLNC